MGWSSSAIFQQSMLNPIAGRSWTTAAPTSYSSLSADTINVALYGNTGTPSKSVSAANTAYNQDQWVSGNEVTSVNWAAGGLPLTSKTFAIDTGSSSIVFGAADLPGGGVVTLTAFYGCLVYDATITGATVKQGLCYNYFGGTNTVTSGTFTIIWATVGWHQFPRGTFLIDLLLCTFLIGAARFSAVGSVPSSTTTVQLFPARNAVAKIVARSFGDVSYSTV